VLSIVHESGLRESDPLFLLMVANSTVQVLLNQAPNELKQTFHDCLQSTRSEYREYERAALTGIKGDIARSVDQLVKAALLEGNKSRAAGGLPSLVSAGAILMGVLVIGVGTGFLASRWLIQRDSRGLTAAEVTALSWGRSREGQFARQLFSWNPTLLNRKCESQARNLGSIEVEGRTLAGGYCFVWTQPPEKRTFEE
jgi:hypothetical protein